MLSNRHTTRTSFDATLGGHDICIEFTRVTAWSSGMEGQDADGNRGMWVTSIDEDYANDIKVSWYDDEPGNSIALAEFPEAPRAAVQSLVDDYLEGHEPEEPEESEPDCDDVGD
jgi:hypothetical protein